MHFEDRIGPDLGADAPTYPKVEVAEWYRDAKLGFFVHWGLYSLPGWAPLPGPRPVPVEEAYMRTPYAEWYANAVRIPGSPTQAHQAETYGACANYEDLADDWTAEGFDADKLVKQLTWAGGKYVVPTSKHHDGFCLWDSRTTPFNAARRGPKRDLIKEIAEATRKNGARFGVYFSGALDWHSSDFPPIQSDVDLFLLRRNDAPFAQHMAAQLGELVDKFAPDILWNDIDWPDAGKGKAEYALASVLGKYFKEHDGVINDRWGVPFHGFLTREYATVPDILPQPWEATRGLGGSFGFNRNEGAEHTLSEAELVRMLVDVVSKNGNLLLNVGPRADGSIPDIQAERLQQLGEWMRVNGEAIYGTRPWVRCREAITPEGQSPVAYTRRAEVLYVHAMDPACGEVGIPPEAAGSAVEWLTADGAAAGEIEERVATIPKQLRAKVVATARVRLQH